MRGEEILEMKSLLGGVGHGAQGTGHRETINGTEPPLHLTLTMAYTDYNTFLLLGDSITEFAFNQFPGPDENVQFSLGAALQNAYARRLQLLHRGFNGYNTRDGVPLVRSILRTEHDAVPDSKKIQLAYVFFGTNDACRKGTSPTNNEHMPLDRFVANMTAIVHEFRQRGIPLVVITPGVHDQKLWDTTHPEDLLTGDCRDNETNKLYQDAVKKHLGDVVPVLPLYDETMAWIGKHGSEKAHSGDYSEILSDGIHFSGLGYRILYDALMKLIEKHYPDRVPANMPLKFPHYSELTDETFAHID